MNNDVKNVTCKTIRMHKNNTLKKVSAKHPICVISRGGSTNRQREFTPQEQDWRVDRYIIIYALKVFKSLEIWNVMLLLTRLFCQGWFASGKISLYKTSPPGQCAMTKKISTCFWKDSLIIITFFQINIFTIQNLDQKRRSK